MRNSRFGLIGMSPSTADKIAAGEQNALLVALLHLAAHWMEQGGIPRLGRRLAAMTDALPQDPDRFGARTAEQRTLLAAGCDLHDLLVHSPQGRQALEDLLAQPIAHNSKGKG